MNWGPLEDKTLIKYEIINTEIYLYSTEPYLKKNILNDFILDLNDSNIKYSKRYFSFASPFLNKNYNFYTFFTSNNSGNIEIILNKTLIYTSQSKNELLLYYIDLSINELKINNKNVNVVTAYITPFNRLIFIIKDIDTFIKISVFKINF